MFNIEKQQRWQFLPCCCVCLVHTCNRLHFFSVPLNTHKSKVLERWSVLARDLFAQPKDKKTKINTKWSPSTYQTVSREAFLENQQVTHFFRKIQQKSFARQQILSLFPGKKYVQAVTETISICLFWEWYCW